MMTKTTKTLLAAAVVALAAGSVQAQTTWTDTSQGTVFSSDGGGYMRDYVGNVYGIGNRAGDNYYAPPPSQYYPGACPTCPPQSCPVGVDCR
jgi:hypothetical protein